MEDFSGDSIRFFWIIEGRLNPNLVRVREANRRLHEDGPELLFEQDKKCIGQQLILRNFSKMTMLVGEPQD
jgi:hypothetical protein